METPNEGAVYDLHALDMIARTMKTYEAEPKNPATKKNPIEA